MSASSRGSSSGNSKDLQGAPSADAGPSRLPRLSAVVDTHPSSSSAASSSSAPATFFPSSALDHAFAGITAGAIATVCMNPLDLIKTKFQVDTSSPYFDPSPSGKGKGPAGAGRIPFRESMLASIRRGKVVTDIYGALREIVVRDGWAGLYRGLSPNVVGNSASWGLYFLWYTMIKEHMSLSEDPSDRNRKLTATQHLLAASESGAVTALMTNPIWVVKTRMFTVPLTASSSTSSLSRSGTSASASDNPYRTLRSSLSHIYRTEGIRGLWKGAGLALFGVSNGAIQFMAYEQLKRYRSDGVIHKRGGVGALHTDELGSEGQVKLSNTEYVVISGSAKLLAILATYPYQVIRSRVQNHSSSPSHTSTSSQEHQNPRYPTVRSCIRQTWVGEGARGFYKGLGTNLVRILPATCVTFVVYENVTWALQTAANGKRARRSQGTEAGGSSDDAKQADAA